MNLNDQVNVLSVRYAFYFLLGRFPENEDVINSHIAGCSSVEDLRASIMNSNEYKKSQIISSAPYHWEAEYAQIHCEIFKSDTFQEIKMIQTCDPVNYAKILEEGSKYNLRWCLEHKVNYQVYTGIKVGDLPHYAMFNRIFMLEEMVNDGYSGWVIYLDSDGIVVDREMDIHEFLTVARENDKSFIFHPVSELCDSLGFLEVNTACFMLDLNSSNVRFLIRKWAEFYRIYFPLAINMNLRWDSLINDQSSLTFLLKSMPFIVKNVLLYPLETAFSVHAIREDNLSQPQDEENKSRVERLRKIASNYY